MHCMQSCVFLIFIVVYIVSGLTTNGARNFQLSDSSSIKEDTHPGFDEGLGVPPTWYTFGDWNYLVDDTPSIQWEDARTVCQNYGGDLAIIRSSEENQFVWDLVTRQNTVTELGAWIGLFRKDDSNFYWVDDTPLQQEQYLGWKAGQPDNSGGRENCGHLIDEKWNDLPCNSYGEESKSPVILCQRSIQNVTKLYIFGDWNYYVDDTPSIQWEDARTVCQKNGGDLAIIRSSEENQFVWDLVTRQNTVTELGAWIGLFRKDDSNFYWVDDTPLQQEQYLGWKAGQPDNSGGRENCGHLIEGKWNDLLCDSHSDDIFIAPVILCQMPIRFSRCPLTHPNDRTECGCTGLTEQECKDNGCCFETSVPRVPFCFSPTDNSPIWHTYGGVSYYVDDTPAIRWNDARKVCQTHGGDLAIIKSAAENDFVWELISKQKTVTIWGAWIGLSRGDDSKFYWVDDTPLLESQFAIWRPGQPDNFWNKENCGHIIEGKWNDLPCDLLGEVFNAPVILCQK